jgi:serine/threonine-protein kinase RsbT
MRTVESEIGAILDGAISEITQRSIFRRLGRMARSPLQQLSVQDRQAIQAELETSVRLFAPARSGELIASCWRALAPAGLPGAATGVAGVGTGGAAGHFGRPRAGGTPSSTALPPGSAARPGAPAAVATWSAARLRSLNGASPSPAPGGKATAAGAAAATAFPGTVPSPAGPDRRLAIESEQDIASARLEAWSEAVRIGLSKFAAVKVATAVSELARNIVFYAGRGTIEVRPRQEADEIRLEILAADQGPGIAADLLESVFAGTFRSQRGMGKGLVAVRRLVDDFHLDTRPGRGTRVTCVFRGTR